MLTQTYQEQASYSVPAQIELLRRVIADLENPMYGIPKHHKAQICKPEVGEPYVQIADLKITASAMPFLNVYRVYIAFEGYERLVSRPLNTSGIALWVGGFMKNNNFIYAYKR